MAGTWYQPLPSAAKFALVGVANTLLDLAIFALLVNFAEWVPARANIVSYGCGLLNSFMLNRQWTFAYKGGRSPAVQFARFALVNLGALGLSTLVVWGASPVVGPMPAKAAAIVLTFGWNYFLTRDVVFGA